MERDLNFSEETDGRLYTSRDMVKIGCQDCKGCYSCCEDMEDTIVIDPYDSWRMRVGLKQSFEEMCETGVELTATEGLLLPHLRNTGNNGRCVYLNKEGRCSIHPYRPGICRLFPLARLYDGDKFKYIIQVNQCPATNRRKVRIEKWLETPGIKYYETYLSRWHRICRLTRLIIGNSEDSVESKKQLIFVFYKLFYQKIEPAEDFYEQFDKAASTYEKVLGME